MTVSRVINNHPSVKATTRKKVLVAIIGPGYEQNEAARLLKGHRAVMIGRSCPICRTSFLPHVRTLFNILPVQMT